MSYFEAVAVKVRLLAYNELRYDDEDEDKEMGFE